MSLTASQILAAIASQFDSDPNRSTHLTLATQRTNSQCFGDNYQYAIALRAAHTLTMSKQASVVGGSAGGITSKKEGDLSVSYGGQTSTGVSGDLGQTSYGVELQGLINGNIPGIQITGLQVDCAGNVNLESII